MSAKYTKTKRRSYRDVVLDETETKKVSTNKTRKKNIVKELKDKKQNKLNKLKSFLTSFFKK